MEGLFKQTDMKKLILSGIIELGDWCDYWRSIKLVQSDGYKLDLIARIIEAKASFGYGNVQLNYYISDAPNDRGKIIENTILNYSGAINGSFEANEYRYSSWTSGTDYDTELKIGRHNLYNELISEVGKFIHIEINFS